MKITKSTYIPLLVIIILLGFSITFIFLNHSKNVVAAKNTVSATSDPALDTKILSLEVTISSNPKIIKNYFDLSNAYLQKVRETGDSVYYQKIDNLMTGVEMIEPNNTDIAATRASVAIGRHHFLEGKKFAEAAIAQNKNKEAYYGLLGDADIELGQYDEAVSAFQKMVDIRPDFASYSRIAYIRELYGDIPGAEQALNTAIASGSSFKENIAWAYVELGKLVFRKNLDQADTYFNQALQVLPTYSQAEEGLGRVDFAKGDSTTAIEHFTKALNILPLAQYSTDRADVYTVLGDTKKRDQNTTLTQAAYANSNASGVNTDLEDALFLADHHINLARALEEAKRAYSDRPSEYAADYLAWSYYQNGDYASATKYTKDALRLGDFDPLILFHEGMIAYKNNDLQHAKKYLGEAFAISPHFSIQYETLLKDTLAQVNNSANKI